MSRSTYTSSTCVLAVLLASLLLILFPNVESCSAWDPPPGCPDDHPRIWFVIKCIQTNGRPPGAPNPDDDWGEDEPPVGFPGDPDGPLDPKAGPPLDWNSDARSIGSYQVLERFRSQSINAHEQIFTDRGEEVYTVDDLVISGVGFDYKHTRTYRSQETTDRSQGVNWSHNHEDRIIIQRAIGVAIFGADPGPTQIWTKAGDYPGDNARWDVYRFQPNDPPARPFTVQPAHPNATFVYVSPNDMFNRIESFDTTPFGQLNSDDEMNGDWRDDEIILYSRDGVQRIFRTITNLPGVNVGPGVIPSNWAVMEGYLTQTEDANGNQMNYEYTLINGDYGYVRLSKVTDTLGRVITYTYYDNAAQPGKYARIKQIKDFLGRTVDYDYDPDGNLVEAIRPSVSSNSIVSNSFSGSYRKTEIYDYSEGYFNRRLNHNLISVIRANENDNRHGIAPDDTPALSWTYYSNDRVKTHTIGNVTVNGADWEAGGTFTYEYNTGQSAPSEWEDAGEFSTTEYDPRGNKTVYSYTKNNRGSLVRLEKHITNLETGQSEVLITTHRYDGEYQNNILTVHPDNSITLKEYDTRAPSRTQNANLVRMVHYPAPSTPGGIETSDQSAIEFRYAYDPVYNRKWIEVGPRGAQGFIQSLYPNHYQTITPGLIEIFDSSNMPQSLYNLPAATPYVPPNGGVVSPNRYVTEYVYDYQESTVIDPLAPAGGLQLDVTDIALRVGLDAPAMRAAIDYAEWQRARVLSITVPAGNSPPSRMGLGDINGDGRINQYGGNLVQTVYPDVLMPDGTTQERTTKARYDDRGRAIVEIDANSNETHYAYGQGSNTIGSGFGVINTASTLGFLETITVDPNGLNLVTQFARNPLNQILKVTDARGNESTTTYNELGQAIRSQSYQGEEATGVLMDESFIIYDANDNVIANYVTDLKTDASLGPAGYTYVSASKTGSLPITSVAIGTVPTPPGVNSPQTTITTHSPLGLIGQRHEYNLNNLKIRSHIESTHPAPSSPSLWLTTEYRYDPNGNMSWTKYPEGNITTTIYDERNLVFQVTNGVGTLDSSTVTNYYDAMTNLVKTVDAHHNGGTSHQIQPGGVPALPSLTNIQIIGLPGQSLSVVDHSGDVTRYYYDGYNRLKRKVDAIGNESINIYDPVNNIVETAYYGPIGGISPTELAGDIGTNNELLSLTRMRHDEANRIYRTDRLVGRANNVNPVRSANLSDSDGYYDPDDISPPNGFSFQEYGGWLSGQTVFDANSNVLESYDDDGHVNTTVYDALNRPTIITDPVGNFVETFYDSNSNVNHIRYTDFDQSDPGNPEIIEAFFDFDALNRKTRGYADPGDGNIYDYYGYDSRSNPIVHIDARGNVSYSFYDAASRGVGSVIEMTTDGTGATALDPTQGGGDGKILIRSVFDKNSRVVAQIDDNNNKTKHDYDALNRKIITTFGQHTLNDVAVTADEATLYGVSAGGNLADQKDNPTIKTWAYDKDSNVIQHIDQNGSTHIFTYDGESRRTQVDITYASGNPHYLAGTTQQLFQYDGLGRQIYSKDNNGTGYDVTCRWQYDLLNRTIQETTTIGSFPERVQSWEYNGDLADAGSGLPTAQYYADNRKILFSYDLDDRIKSLADANGGGPTLAEYYYIGPGTRTKQIDRRNGFTTHLLYDDIRRRIGIFGLNGPTSSSIAFGLSYTYDGEHLPQKEYNHITPKHSEFYVFDSASRIKEMLRGTPLTPTSDTLNVHIDITGVTQARTFNLDGAHNWTSHTTMVDNGVNSEIREHTNFNEVHTAPSTTGVPAALTYDDQGNLLTRNLTAVSGVTYHWDALNRLYEVREAGTLNVLASYLHSTGNQRVSRTISNGGISGDTSLDGTTHFYYAGWRLCDEYDVNGTESLKHQYVWGPRYQDELICRDDRTNGTSIPQLNDGIAGGAGASSGRQYQHTDRSWNIRAVSDESGAVLERYLYDPFGKPFVFDITGTTLLSGTQIEQSYGFTSQRYDAETKLWYFKHRYLDDGLGRFISRDPSGYVDGMNLYTAYFVMTGVDPLGLQVDYERMFDAIDSNSGKVSVGNIQVANPNNELYDQTVIGFRAAETFVGVVAVESSKEVAGNVLTGGALTTYKNAKRLVDGVDTLIDSVRASRKLAKEAAEELAEESAQRLRNAEELADMYRRGGFDDKADEVMMPFTDGCFVAGTLVMTEDGATPIEELAADTMVWSIDVISQEWHLSRVIMPLTHMYDGDIIIISVDGTDVKATGNHPFWVVSGDELMQRPDAIDLPPNERIFTESGRWVQARDLRYGDVLSLYSGKYPTVTDISRYNARANVYNIEVEGYHTYAVSTAGIAVHNKAMRAAAPDDVPQIPVRDTPRAARRQAMRDAGIPTSQQPVSQTSPRTPPSADAPTGKPAGRQYTYETPSSGGGTQTSSVQHSLTDEGHGPHWEAGNAKAGGQTDSLGRPRLRSDKAKVDEKLPDEDALDD